jgi:hypothetical protein
MSQDACRTAFMLSGALNVSTANILESKDEGYSYRPKINLLVGKLEAGD